MPGKDGRGPEGKGPKTGRGLGPCSKDNPKGCPDGKWPGKGRPRRRRNRRTNK
jgi:hypothetical protein